MLLWLLFVGTLQASVASSYRGFWDAVENHDASNFQHVSSDQSQPQLEFYQPKSNSLPWPQIQDPKRIPRMNSGQPCFHSKPQLPGYWPYPVPQSPHVPGAGLQPLQVPDPHLPTYTTRPWQHSWFQPPSNQPTPAPPTQQPNQQPQAPGLQASPLSNMPQSPGPASKPPSRLLEYWYRKLPQHQSQSSTYPFNLPQSSSTLFQVPSLQPQKPSAVPYQRYQQRPQQRPGNLPQPAPSTQQPSLPTNPPQAPRPQAQSSSKLFHQWYQQNPQQQQQQQQLSYLFNPQPGLQQPSLPSNLPQTPQLTPATQQPDLSNKLPPAQPQSKLPHPWYQSPIYLLNPQPYPWLPPQSAPSSNLPQPSPAPSSNLPQPSPAPSSPPTTQQPVSSTATQQPAPPSLPYMHGPESHLSNKLLHPWYQQFQLPSLVEPLPHPWFQVPGPLPQLPFGPQQPSNWPHAAAPQAQPPSRPLQPWYQLWPPMHGYLPEPMSYWPPFWPYGPSNLPNAWSWYQPHWPIHSPWASYLPAVNGCKPPLLCYEVRSNGGFDQQGDQQ